MATILPDGPAVHQCAACGQDLPRFTATPSAPVDGELIRQLFRECVTVVQPGETLIVRVPVTWTAQQVRAYQEVMDWDQQEGRPFPVLVVVAEELGVAGKPDEPAEETLLWPPCSSSDATGAVCRPSRGMPAATPGLCPLAGTPTRSSRWAATRRSWTCVLTAGTASPAPPYCRCGKPDEPPVS